MFISFVQSMSNVTENTIKEALISLTARDKFQVREKCIESLETIEINSTDIYYFFASRNLFLSSVSLQMKDIMDANNQFVTFSGYKSHAVHI